MENPAPNKTEKRTYFIVEAAACALLLTNALWGFTFQKSLCGLMLPTLIAIGVTCVLTLAGAAAVVINFKKLTKKARSAVCAVLLLALCGLEVDLSLDMLSDLKEGVVTVSTDYYFPGKKLLIYNADDTLQLSLSDKQKELIEELSPTVDKSRKLKVSDNLSVYSFTPGITVEYYPNTKMVKSVKAEGR